MTITSAVVAGKQSNMFTVIHNCFEMLSDLICFLDITSVVNHSTMLIAVRCTDMKQPPAVHILLIYILA